MPTEVRRGNPGAGRRRKRLNFQNQRTGTLIDRCSGRSFCGFTHLLDQRLRKVCDFCQSFFSHFESADFICRAEAVFQRTQNPEIVTPFSGKIKYGIHQMFYDFRTRQISGFCHMSHDEYGEIAAFADTHQFVSAYSHLRYGTRSGVQLCRVHGLYRIDDEKGRLNLFFLCDNIFHVCLGENIEGVPEYFCRSGRPAF